MSCDKAISATIALSHSKRDLRTTHQNLFYKRLAISVTTYVWGWLTAGSVS